MMSFRDDACLYWQMSELAHDAHMVRTPPAGVSGTSFLLPLREKVAFASAKVG